MPLRSTTASRPRALVVDDEPVSRLIATERLIELGAIVEEATNGGEALALLVSGSFDMAVIDLEMPGLDGFDLLGCIRGHPKLKHMPIIVLTGNANLDSVQRALAAGATSYLLKPLNWAAFGDHIKHVLNMQRTRVATS